MPEDTGASAAESPGQDGDKVCCASRSRGDAGEGRESKTPLPHTQHRHPDPHHALLQDPGEAEGRQ